MQTISNVFNLSYFANVYFFSPIDIHYHFAYFQKFNWGVAFLGVLNQFLFANDELNTIVVYPFQSNVMYTEKSIKTLIDLRALQPKTPWQRQIFSKMPAAKWLCFEWMNDMENASIHYIIHIARRKYFRTHTIMGV